MALLAEHFAPGLWRRAGWLLSLRWTAAAGVFGAVTFGRFVLRVSLPLPAMYGGVGALCLSNILYSLWFRRLQGKSGEDMERNACLLVGLQVAVDLALLAYLLHFSGGVGNPFVLFFVFHMVIAGILLPGVAAYLQAAWATVLFAGMLAGDAFGFLPSYPLPLYFPREALLGRPAFILALLAAFTATEFITVYLTAGIAKALRARERELRRSVEDLEEANVRLERKDQEQSQYVQRVSHHIKGSLSAIQSCLRVVLDGLLGRMGSRAREMVVRAERRSLSLLRYANELLYLSSLRVEGRLVDSRLVPAASVGRVVRELHEAYQAKGVDFQIRDETSDAPLRADARLFAELIRHLLENALKYTQRGGKVALRLSAAAPGRQLEIAVADTGIGIRPEDLPYVFDDFYAADIPENREGTGAGLGLSIARQIVLMHGGSLSVESLPGAGSTFTCLLPDVEQEVQGGVHNGRESQDLGGGRRSRCR
jgi:signal transduction histidine kinase